MKTKFNQLHPTLDALLTKLADPAHSVRDCTAERLDWVKANCPVMPGDGKLWLCRNCDTMNVLDGTYCCRNCESDYDS